MNKFTIHFELHGCDCEIDFRADCSDEETAYEAARAIVASIPAARYHYVERIGRV